MLARADDDYRDQIQRGMPEVGAKSHRYSNREPLSCRGRKRSSRFQHRCSRLLTLSPKFRDRERAERFLEALLEFAV